jgi:hypothetical protein
MADFLDERAKLMEIISDTQKRKDFAKDCKATLKAEGMPYDTLDAAVQSFVDYLCGLSAQELKVLADTNQQVLKMQVSPENSTKTKLGRAV